MTYPAVADDWQDRDWGVCSGQSAGIPRDGQGLRLTLPVGNRKVLLGPFTFGAQRFTLRRAFSGDPRRINRRGAASYARSWLSAGGLCSGLGIAHGRSGAAATERLAVIASRRQTPAKQTWDCRIRLRQGDLKSYWKWMHFSGVAGAGMNPLARLFAGRQGFKVTGSDRALDAGQCGPIRELLERAGVEILPQDGSAVSAELDRFIYSAAVEPDTPEMRAAIACGVETVARPGLLAEVVDAGGPGLAVSGTSGKSTVVGMIAWILKQQGVSATVLGGAALAEDGAQHMGCLWAREAAPVIAEACESDGTLIGYHPGNRPDPQYHPRPR